MSSEFVAISFGFVDDTVDEWCSQIFLSSNVKLQLWILLSHSMESVVVVMGVVHLQAPPSGSSPLCPTPLGATWAARAPGWEALLLLLAPERSGPGGSVPRGAYPPCWPYGGGQGRCLAMGVAGQPSPAPPPGSLVRGGLGAVAGLDLSGCLRAGQAPVGAEQGGASWGVPSEPRALSKLLCSSTTRNGWLSPSSMTSLQPTKSFRTICSRYFTALHPREISRLTDDKARFLQPTLPRMV